MSIRLTQAEIQWIKQEYEAGNTVQDIVFDTFLSHLCGVEAHKRANGTYISNRSP